MSFNPTKAQIGYGTTIGYGAADGTGSVTNLAEIIGVSPGKLAVGKVETDRMDSDSLNNLPIEEKIAGWINQDDLGLKLSYDKGGTQYAAIRAMAGIDKRWVITRPDGAVHGPVKGFICEIGDEIPMKEKMTVDIKICLKGVPSFAVAP